MLRIHCETDWLLALAADPIRFTSLALRRNATSLPFASPFGSLGRPTFLVLGWAGITELLNDKRSYGGYGGYDGRDVYDGDILGWPHRIAGIARPGIRCIRAWMAAQ